MRNTFILVMAMFAAVSVLAQNKTYNDPNAERRNVSGFHAVSTANGIDLVITQGNEETVVVSAAKEEYRDKIITEVENGVLKIYYESKTFGYSGGWGWTNRKLKAYISVRNLDGIKASGGSDVVIDGTLSSDKLRIGLSGGSDFKGNVSAGTLDIGASGGSDVNISGRATTLMISASGGSDMDGYELVVENCNASCSGGSDINITVNKELVAEASGGSDIHYRGNASVKSSNSSGGSSVSKRGK